MTPSKTCFFSADNSIFRNFNKHLVKKNADNTCILVLRLTNNASDFYFQFRNYRYFSFDGNKTHILHPRTGIFFFRIPPTS